MPMRATPTPWDRIENEFGPEPDTGPETESATRLAIEDEAQLLLDDGTFADQREADKYVCEEIAQRNVAAPPTQTYVTMTQKEYARVFGHPHVAWFDRPDRWQPPKRKRRFLPPDVKIHMQGKEV